MENPLVTILSPTYNHAKYIGACIESAQAQSFASWEMIILNDGSTDATASIAQTYADKDQRIRIINQDNIGVFRLGETYNKGLGMARGKYIAILEGDDLWVPDKLEKQVDILEMNPGFVLAWGKAELVNEDLNLVYSTNPFIEEPVPDRYRNIPTGAIIEAMDHGNIMPALTILFRKSALMDAGGFNQSFGMPLVDFPTILNVSQLGPFYFTTQTLGRWRIYSTQTTKKYTVEIYKGMYQFLQQHLPRVRALTNARRRQILTNYNHLTLIAFARSGRYRLIRKEFSAARKDYARAITYPLIGEWAWRLRSMIGYVFSLFHLDVEGLAGLLGKKTYKG